MRKTYLYTLDHEEFRRLIGSGERGLADRLLKRYREGSREAHEADVDDLEEILRKVEERGTVEATGDSETDDLLNEAIWLLAEEAGIDAATSGASTDIYAEADAAFGKSGWFSKAPLSPASLALFRSLYEGRVYGRDEAWTCDLRTAVMDPGEVKTLIGALRDAGGSKLPSEVQDLLDNFVFPSLEAAARASMGVVAVTRRLGLHER